MKFRNIFLLAVALTAAAVAGQGFEPPGEKAQPSFEVSEDHIGMGTVEAIPFKIFGQPALFFVDDPEVFMVSYSTGNVSLKMAAEPNRGETPFGFG